MCGSGVWIGMVRCRMVQTPKVERLLKLIPIVNIGAAVTATRHLIVLLLSDPDIMRIIGNILMVSTFSVLDFVFA